MNTIFYLSTCDTCRKILKRLDLQDDIVLQDIKTQKISPDQLERLEEKMSDIAELFSKKARNYRLMGLHTKELSPSDMRKLILEDYTFLSRPVALIDDEIFIGNREETVIQLEKKIGSRKGG
jgi:arsenate reductase (glutaredoxin)